LNEQPSIWCFFSIVQITLMFCGVLASQGGGDSAEKKRPQAATRKGKAVKVA